MSGSKWTNVGEESSSLCMGTIGVSKSGLAFPIRCKRWDCPICAPINACRWAIEVANGINALHCAGVTFQFVTLTESGKLKDVRYAYDLLARQWDTWRKKHERWADKHGVPWFYAAFVEGQGRRAGMPHFHVISAWPHGKSTIKDWAVQSGLGYMVDVQDIQANSGVAWYVSKYSTKSSDAATMPRGFRRCRISQNWPRVSWRVDEESSASVVKRWNETMRAFVTRAAYELEINRCDIERSVALLVDGDDEKIVDLYKQAEYA